MSLAETNHRAPLDASGAGSLCPAESPEIPFHLHISLPVLSYLPGAYLRRLQNITHMPFFKSLLALHQSWSAPPQGPTSGEQSFSCCCSSPVLWLQVFTTGCIFRISFNKYIFKCPSYNGEDKNEGNRKSLLATVTWHSIGLLLGLNKIGTIRSLG